MLEKELEDITRNKNEEISFKENTNIHILFTVQIFQQCVQKQLNLSIHIVFYDFIGYGYNKMFGCYLAIDFQVDDFTTNGGHLYGQLNQPHGNISINRIVIYSPYFVCNHGRATQ